MKKERIVRYTRSNLPLGRIDRARVEAMTEAEIDAIAESDLDNPPATDEEMANAVLVRPEDRKAAPLDVRIDADVVAFYMADGEGYQRRINADLREAMQRKLGGSRR